MIERFRAAALVLPGLLAVVGVVILVMLGNWQWQRLQWKEGLIAKLAETAKAAPVPLQGLTSADHVDDVRFRRVTVRGTFDHRTEMHVWSPGDNGPG
ncbi:MAG: SURF1 family protein, partial [Pseudomonadota bacterium]